MKANRNIELRVLKTILGLYIILCFLIAGLNYGYASRASAKTAAFINWFWLFYENEIKVVFIIISSFLTMKIINKSKITTMRKKNLSGFIITALVVHIIFPLILNNNEVYLFTMPLPWTTAPLQLMDSKSSFYLSHIGVWGLNGITSILIFYVCYSILIFVGTILFGRRWQCSTLCLFNGFASEVFAPAFPLVGKNREVKPNTLKTFSVLRWAFLVIALTFTLFWNLFLFGLPLGAHVELFSKIESYEYLCGQLLMAMFFWIAFIGRGYCYYCPLGTILSLLGKVAGQEITTSNTKCIQCNQCNKACPMSIDIKNNAQKGDAVRNIRCVGCGHCIDACPTRNLAYTTKFLSYIHKRN